jgi:hypothetical protein
MSAERLARAYRKILPVTAGISNVNVGRTWAAEYHPRVLLDYLRFTPTGPNLPLAFTPSSLGRRFHVSLTYRVGLVGDDRAARIAESFIRRMKLVAQQASPSAATTAMAPATRLRLAQRRPA